MLKLVEDMAFSDLTCHLENTGTGIFCLHCAVSYSKETEMESSNQVASPSAGKNTGIVLLPCPTLQCVPKAISGGGDVFKVPGCHMLRQMSSQ